MRSNPGRLKDGWSFSTAVVSEEVLFVTRRLDPAERTLFEEMKLLSYPFTYAIWLQKRAAMLPPMGTTPIS